MRKRTSGKKREPQLTAGKIFGQDFRKTMSGFWLGLGKFASARGTRLDNASRMPRWLVGRLSRRPKLRNYCGWTYKGRKGVPTRFGMRHYFSREIILKRPLGARGKKQEIQIAIYLQPVSIKKSKRPLVNVGVNGPYYIRFARTPSGHELHDRMAVPDFEPDLKKFVDAFLKSMDLNYKEGDIGINQTRDQLSQPR